MTEDPVEEGTPVGSPERAGAENPRTELQRRRGHSGQSGVEPYDEPANARSPPTIPVTARTSRIAGKNERNPQYAMRAASSHSVQEFFLQGDGLQFGTDQITSPVGAGESAVRLHAWKPPKEEVEEGE